MIQAFFILFYVLVLGFCIYKLPLFHLRKISKTKVLGLFLLKVLAGLSYVFISKHVIEAGDLVHFYNDSQIVYEHLLRGDLWTYLQLTFGLNNVAITENIASSVDAMGYWFNTSLYMMVRFNAAVSVLTFGVGVYANSIFFAFISFWGAILFARLFEDKLDAEPVALYAMFLMPSLWYWTSGMHKETLSVFLLAAILLSLLDIAVKKRVLGILLALMAFVLLFYTRFFIAMMLIPSLLAYFVTRWKKEWSPLLVFLALFVILLSCTYIVPKLSGSPNLVDAVMSKKSLYEALDNGSTVIHLGEYERSYWGIAKVVPQALFNTMVRPHFLDVKSFFLALASLESLIITILFVVALFYIKNCRQEEKSIIYLCMSFALSYLILTGLIVPNLGAILRYRSVALFFLVPCLFYLVSRKNELKN